jgi:hypothetical protein
LEKEKIINEEDVVFRGESESYVQENEDEGMNEFLEMLRISSNK